MDEFPKMSIPNTPYPVLFSTEMSNSFSEVIFCNTTATLDHSFVYADFRAG